MQMQITGENWCVLAMWSLPRKRAVSCRKKKESGDTNSIILTVRKMERTAWQKNQSEAEGGNVSGKEKTTGGDFLIFIIRPTLLLWSISISRQDCINNRN